MTDEAQSPARAAFSYLKIPREILGNRWLFPLFIVFAILAAFNLALAPAYISTQKAREETAVADNAALLQQAQAAIVEQQAITQTELAKNAERKQKADAKKAKAEALKAKAEQEIAAQIALNADIAAKAEADEQTAQAEIEKQTLVIKKEVARQAFRIKTAEALEAEMQAAVTKLGNIIQRRPITSESINGFLFDSLHGTNQPPGERLYIPQPPEKFDFEDLAEKQAVAPNNATPQRQTFAAPDPLRAPARPQPGVLARVSPEAYPIQGACRSAFEAWKNKGAYAAFAVGPTTCGQAYEYDSLAAAKRAALQYCRYPQCVIVYEIAPAAEQPASIEAKQPEIQTMTAAPRAQATATFRIKAEVEGGYMNMRDGPGLGHRTLAQIPEQSIVRQIAPCIGSDDNTTRYPWCKVQWNGATGWVNSSGLETVD
jgi:hypothetical protein